MKLQRRGFLQSLGGIGLLGLPLLRNYSAQAAAGSKKVVVFYVPGGGSSDRPNGGYTFDQNLKSLEPFKSNLIFLNSIGNRAATSATFEGDSHAHTMTTLLTCNRDGMKGGCTSFDQLLSKELGGATPFPSLQLGADTQNSDNIDKTRINFAGGNWVQPDENPYNVFTRVFGNIASTGMAGSSGNSVANNLKKSILDNSIAEINELYSRVGATEKTKLDLELTTIREVEKRLNSSADKLPAVGCSKPLAPASKSKYVDADFPAVVKLQMDLLHAALVCDLTRFATLQLRSSGSSSSYPWLGISSSEHDLEHHFVDTTQTATKQLFETRTWYADQFAYFLTKLSSTPDPTGSGTLLDNTVVLYITEFADGSYHSMDKITWLLAGGQNLGVKSGRTLDFASKGHNEIISGVMQIAGSATTSLGSADLNSTPFNFRV